MRRLFPLGLLIFSASMSMGCAMCCSPYDYAFGYHGGAWQRDELCTGRVGSVFAPAGSKVLTTEAKKAETETVPPAEPPPESEPEAKPKADLDAGVAPRQLKSVKRTRPSRSYLPTSD
jgi:hypothetical protein